MAILLTEDAWRNSQLSLARFYGRVKFDGHEYWVVDKKGRDLFECTHLANKEGRSMAIEPGEPADLVRKDFIPLYKKLGRDAFIEVLKGPNCSDEELKRRMKEKLEEKQNERK